MNQRRDLILHRLYHRGGTVAQQIAAPTRKQIEVAVPFAVPDPRPFAAHQVNRVAVVIRDNVFLEQFDGSGRVRFGGDGHRGSRHEVSIREKQWDTATAPPVHRQARQGAFLTDSPPRRERGCDGGGGKSSCGLGLGGQSRMISVPTPCVV